MFVGFEKLTAEEQRKVTITKTHLLMRYSLKEDNQMINLL